MDNSDTIDITDLVEKTRSSFVDWAVAYLFGLEVAIPGMEWVALPIVSQIDQEVIRIVIDALSKSAEMLAFFTNTVMRKATQSQDFIDAVNYKDSLPANASDEEYAKAEASQMDAFRNFVALTD